MLEMGQPTVSLTHCVCTRGGKSSFLLRFSSHANHTLTPPPLWTCDSHDDSLCECSLIPYSIYWKQRLLNLLKSVGITFTLEAKVLGVTHFQVFTIVWLAVGEHLQTS